MIITIIPARGGSKGIPRKNVLPLNGIPLIGHSLSAAAQARLVDLTVVTTDDEEIATVAKSYGAEVIERPAELASDTASSESALLHALEEILARGLNPELIVFLQCTSPLRTSEDIDQAIRTLQAEEADSLLSVCPSHRFLWQYDDAGNPQSINYDYRNRQRRQDMKAQFVENGSIYIFKPWVLRTLNNRLGGKIALYEMKESQNWEIDSIEDFEYIAHLMRNTELVKSNS